MDHELDHKPRTHSLRVWFIRSTIGILAVLIASTVAFLRMPSTSRGVVWAEDGSIFLRDAMERKGLLDIFAPYDGYLHILPRFAAKFVVRFFRIDDYGFAVNFLSCVVVGIVAILVFYFSKAVTSNVYARLGWASITVLVAPAPIETLGNLANIHSYLLWLTPWLLMKPAKSRLEGVAFFFIAIIVSLTEIVALIFLPMFAWRFKEGRLWPARAGFVIGLAMQFTTTILYPRFRSDGHQVDLFSVIIGWFLNTSSALVYGSSRQVGANIQNFGIWPALLAATAFMAAWAFILVRGNAQQRAWSIVFVMASAALWSVTLIMNFTSNFDYAKFDQEQWTSAFFFSRYSTVPSMFLLALLPLAVLCDRLQARRVGAGIMAALIVLQAVYFFPTGTTRDNGPDWQTGVELARTACVADPGLEFSAVVISPANWLKGGLDVPCSMLRPPV